ncbi:MAG: DUF305 domain-containing protein [Allosphingosinicella sp.]|uniref:DUF305 domain-containing protein n=1 Tax=Allosphingosinicella sp. TaxID=2823234 RepID=UPI00395415D6
MKHSLKSKRILLAASLIALLAACGGGEGNQTEQANSQQQRAIDSAQAMPSGPFAQAEMQMNERMMASSGANASETWARKMIEHHRGAVAMSQILIDQGGEQRFVEMARQTIEKQQREIGELEQLVAGGITGGSGEANPFGPVEQSMHQRMMAASGGNISETWARKMIAHHQGAVDMSEALIRQGGNPEVLAMARRTAEDQRREIAHLEAMLRGEAMAPRAAAPAPSASASASAKQTSGGATSPVAREPSPAPKARPAERPAPRNQTPPRAATQPTPAPAATPTCAPEHRALGHC